MPINTKNLLLHLTTTPDMPTNLRTLHDLALYESGDALLGPEEKTALQATAHLAGFLDRVDPDDLRQLLSLID